MFARMVLGAVLALTAENVIFAGGAGFSRVLRAAKHPSCAGMYSFFVTGFSLASGLAGWLLSPHFGGPQQVVYPAVLTATTALFYLAAAAFLRAAAKKFYEKYGWMLAQSAANTVVLAIPFVQQTFQFGLSQTVGYALGTGAAFFLAVLILEQAAKTCANPDMPKAFSGLPGMLIYVGILSMAFAGFSGKSF